MGDGDAEQSGFLGIKNVIPGSLRWDGDQFAARIERDLASFIKSPTVNGKIVSGDKATEISLHYAYGSKGLLVSRLEFDEAALMAETVFPKLVSLTWRAGDMPFVKEGEWRVKAARPGAPPSPLMEPTRFYPTNYGSTMFVFSNDEPHVVGLSGLVRVPTVEERNGESWYQRLVSVFAIGMMVVGFLLLKRIFSRRMQAEKT